MSQSLYNRTIKRSTGVPPRIPSLIDQMLQPVAPFHTYQKGSQLAVFQKENAKVARSNAMDRLRTQLKKIPVGGRFSRGGLRSLAKTGVEVADDFLKLREMKRDIEKVSDIYWVKLR